MKARKSSVYSSSSKSSKKGQSPLRPAGQMPVIHAHAAGIDVGATAHWVCVPEDAVGEKESAVREFGAFTKDLDELVEWLLKCGVKTVVMESTSVYWIPLFQMRDAQCSKSTPEELAAALEGDWRSEHLFVLRQSLENYRHLLKQMEVCDVELESALGKVVVNPAIVAEEDRPPNPPAAEGAKSNKKKKLKKLKASTGLKRDLRAQLERICGVDLTKVIGLNVLGVLILISEIGVDMSRWRNAKAFCSWLGLCPGSKISGGKVLSSRTVHVVNRVSILLRMVAPSVGRTDTCLGIFHRRMRARLGPAAANTATARKLACMVYHLLRYKEEYFDVDCLIYQEKIRKGRIAKLFKQAEELGFDVIKKQQAAFLRGADLGKLLFDNSRGDRQSELMARKLRLQYEGPVPPLG